MTSLDAVQRPRSLAERAAEALGRPAPAAPEKVCLLLDVSGSMDEDAEPGRRKIDALREIVRTLEAPYIYAFSRACKRISRENIPDPQSTTALHKAFATVKSRSITRVVLITDGLPDDADAAIREVAGLSIEIFYVGPAPRPAFLDRLVAAAKQGSAAHQSTLASQGQISLTAAVVQRLLLSGGKK